MTTRSKAEAEAESYLASLLGKNLRITTTDTRMFLGQFKCTDSDQNIILSQTFEYRFPPPPKISSPSNPTSTSSSHPEKTPNPTIVQDLPSRYLGLVVVPGLYISKIEVEEFESQLSSQQRLELGLDSDSGLDLKGKGKGKEREEVAG